MSKSHRLVVFTLALISTNTLTVSSIPVNPTTLQTNQNENQYIAIHEEVVVELPIERIIKLSEEKMPQQQNPMAVEIEPEVEEIIVEEEVVDDGRIAVNFLISFYTSLACENTKYGAVDALGNPLKLGTIAVPKDIALHSKFYIDGCDIEFTATDRGGKVVWTKDGSMKIDVFVPRNNGESDNAYYKRVNNMGIKKATGYYIPYKKEK